MEERDVKNGVMRFSELECSDSSIEEILVDENVDIETDITKKILIETVLEAIKTLDDKVKWLIQVRWYNKVVTLTL